MPTSKQLLKIKNLIEEEKNKLEKCEKKLNSNIIIGLDLSKQCPGLSVIDIENNKVIFYDKYKETKIKDFYFRMLEIKEWIFEIYQTFKPKFVIIEAPFMNPKTINSNSVLLRMHGYIGHFIMSLGAKVYMISPRAARSFLKIKPNKKEYAFEYVKTNFPELMLNDFKADNDIADSIIVALSYFSENKKLLE